MGEPRKSVSMKVVTKSVGVRWPRVKQMSTTTLTDLLTDSKNSVILLDTRPEEEYSVSHIAGAKRVGPDPTDVNETMAQIMEKTENGSVTVVCYCSLGYRSALYANSLLNVLQQKDGVSVHNLEGSLFQWANEGRPMRDMMDKPTIYAHPYSAVWGKLLKPELRRNTPQTPDGAGS